MDNYSRVVLSTLLVAITGVDAGTKADNAHHYRILCEVYNELVGASRLTPGHFLEAKSYAQAREDEDRIEKLLNESRIASVQAASDQTESGPTESTSQRRETSEDARVFRVQRRLQKLRKILDEGKTSVTETVGGLPKQISQAVLKNEGLNFDSPTLTYTTNRGTTCKATGGNAGDSLVLDFVCLCATDASRFQKPCGLNAPGSNNWNPSNGADSGGSDTMYGISTWKVIKGACEKEATGLVVTSESLAKGLDAFRRSLGSGAKGMTSNEAQAPFIFGTPRLDGTCSPTSDDNGGACVNYHDTSGKPKITWLGTVDGVLASLKQVEGKQRDIAKAIEGIEQLKDEAEEIYESSKAKLKGDKPNHERPNRNSKQNSPSSNDKATAQEPTAVNNAIIPRSILPWTLFI